MNRRTSLPAEELKKLARRLCDLSEDERESLVGRLQEKGIDVGALPFIVGDRPARIPLSYAQQRLWAMEQLSQGRALYNLPSILKLSGQLDVDALERVLAELARRHEVLRTRIRMHDGVPYQEVTRAEAVPLRRVDLSHLPGEEKDEAIQDFCARDALVPFDLEEGRLLRAALLVLSSDEHALMLNMHHIVSDEWSNTLLIEEFLELYDSYTTNSNPQLSEPSLQYADYSIWQRSWLGEARIAGQLEYWVRELGHEPCALRLPTDFQRAGSRSYEAGTHVVRFLPERTNKLKALARANDSTAFMVTLLAFQVLLSRLAGTRKVRVGVPIANRRLAELHDVVGFFSNTQVIQLDVDERASVSRLLVMLRDKVLGAQANQELPFERLVDTLQPERQTDQTPLFEVMFSWHQDESGEFRSRSGLRLCALYTPERVAKFDLLLHVHESAEGLWGEFVYPKDLYLPDTIESMGTRLLRLVDEMTANPEIPFARVPWLQKHEETRLRAGSRTTPQPGRFERSRSSYQNLHSWIQSVATRHGESPAVRHEGRVLSFERLDRVASALAARLMSHGTVVEDRVALCCAPGPELIVGLLGILKTGAAYVPVDPAWPEGRIRKLVRQSGATLVVTDDTCRTSFDAESEVRPVAVVDPEDREDCAPVGVDVDPESAAYVVFTSGSTGRPKGVVVSHAALMAYVHGLLDRLDAPQGARFGMVSTVAADLGNTALFGALCSGGELHLLNGSGHFDVERMAEQLRAHPVDVLKMTPSHAKGFLECSDPGVVLPRHTLVLGGEALTWEVVNRVRSCSTCRIMNHYGPTETTVGVLTEVVGAKERSESEVVPLGCPLSKARVYVLNDYLNPVPEGVIGEVYIGGKSVARGYLDQESQTADRFVPDPACPGQRMYRSGDRGRYDNLGRIHFVGRKDDQVKIRGHRVELAEVQAILVDVLGVTDARVVSDLDAGGSARLSAYLVATNAGRDDAEIESILQRHLPNHMIPNRFVWLDSLPLTSNGKLDREALPRPEKVGLDSIVLPRNELEGLLHHIWCKVLEREDLGVFDNFFRIGGDSILAIRVIALALQEGILLTPAQIFEHQTIARLAAVVAAGSDRSGVATGSEGSSKDLPALRRVERGRPLPASFAQERLWFLWKLEPENPSYHVPVAIRVRGLLDVEVLQKTFVSLQERHEVLRTVFREVDGALLQEIRSSVPLGLERRPIEGETKEEKEDRLLAAIERESLRPFDLSEGPLMRVCLFDLGANECILCIVLHHVLSDGWSMDVLLRDFVGIYTALKDRMPIELGELDIQYADFAAWQRECLAAGEGERQLAYWKACLSPNSPPLELPFDFPRSPSKGAASDSFEFRLGGELVRALKALAVQHDASFFMVLLAAFQVLLHRYSGRNDIAVGVPSANRAHPRVQELVGVFINTQVVLSQTDGRETFATFLEAVKRRALEAQENQDVPFERVVEALRPERSLNHSPLFQILFNHQRRALEGLDHIPGLTLQPLTLPQKGTPFDLSLNTYEVGEEVEAEVVYPTELFERRTAQRISQHWQTLLQEIARNPHRCLFELEFLSDEERQTLVHVGPRKEPSDDTLISRFEEQVRARPSALAVLFGDTALTYAELHRRVRTLASRIRAHGVRAEDRVVVAVDRSPLLPVALLAVLSAGAAYVPLDPSHPEQRLCEIVGDARPSLVLTERSYRETFERFAAGSFTKVLCVESSGGAPSEAEVAKVHAQQCAYCIYTSGTTGRPKGVSVPHAGVVNFLEAMQERLLLAPNDRVLALTAVSFDIAVLELFLPLQVGASVVIADRNQARDPRLLLDLMQSQRVTLVQATPSTWKMILQHPKCGSRLAACTCLSGGEALPLPLSLKLSERAKVAFNVYGPTETTVWSSAGRLCLAEQIVDIGSPLQNTTLYVLDASLRPVAPGCIGELYIGGEGLARGYFARPSLTAERFLPDPFAGQGKRMYRTGDLARTQSNGRLICLGRVDHQVKVRGHRIELGEIESRLMKIEEVNGAAVVLTDAEEPELVAYVERVASSHPKMDENQEDTHCSSATNGQKTELSALAPFGAGNEVAIFRRELASSTSASGDSWVSSLRNTLLEELPEYMVPTRFFELREMPLSGNGKIDRGALPKLQRGTVSRKGRLPHGDLQNRVAEIWREVLGEPQVFQDDSFFQLGGHSLLAVQVTSRIERELGIDLPLRTLFESADLAGFSCRVREAQRCDAPSVVSVPKLESSQGARLSFAQERQWLLHRLEPGSTAYHVPVVLRIHGPLDIEVLRRVLSTLVQRHETLRTRFGALGDEVRSWVLQPADVPLRLVDEAAHEGRTTRVLVEEEIARPFDLESGEVLRAALFQRGTDETTLAITLHHIATDGLSMEILTAEFEELYVAFSEGRRAALRELPVSYADFASFQRDSLGKGEQERLVAYWTQQLGLESPVLELPADFARPKVQTYRGASLLTRIDPDETAALWAFAAERESTPFMLLAAALAACLSRYSGQKDIRLGALNANRTHPDLTGLVGFLANTQVLRFDVELLDSFDALLARTKETVLQAQAHADLPFERLVDVLSPKRTLSHSPLFQVLFNHSHEPQTKSRKWGAVSVEPIESPTTSSQFDLSLDTFEKDGELTMLWTYSTDLFLADTIENFARSFAALVSRLPRESAQTLRGLFSPEALEVQRLLSLGTGPSSSEPDEPGYMARFEQHVRAHPERIAAREGATTWTYAELDRAATRVGAALGGRGVGLGDAVAVACERSSIWLVLVLGVFKVGATYVPVDPRHPEERNGQILRSCGARMVLTTRSSEDRARRFVAVAQRGENAGEEASASLMTWEDVRGFRVPEDFCCPPYHPQRLAYVIHTSGSTGTPKGAMVTEAGMLNNQLSKVPYLMLTESDVIAQTAAVGFDISVWQLLTALLCGATVEIVPDAISGEPWRLLAHVAERGVTILQCVPGVIQMMLQEESKDLEGLRFMIPTGEALTQGVVDAWFRNYPNVPLVNAYGPAECADDVALATIRTPRQESERRLPIGHATANTRLLVMDASLSLVPCGVVGELAVAGIGVGHGYLNEPGRTAQSFVPNPYGGPGERLYLTGDLARFRKDGQLEYVARRDHQVKIRGHRIELGEIESTLQRLPGVAEAGVVLVGRGDGKQLRAYVELEHGADASESSLREEVSKLVPGYMVPQSVTVLARLPRNSSEKLDRKALLALCVEHEPKRREAPATALESRVAKIWSELLDSDVGRSDNFFERGGHSLLATRVTARLTRELGREVPLRAMFEAEDLAGFCKLLEIVPSEEISSSNVPLRRVSERARSLASHAQQRMWFLWQLSPESSAYHLPIVVRFRKQLDRVSLERALLQLAFRHESLRTRFEETEQGVFQLVDEHPLVRVEERELALEAGVPSEVQVRRQVETEVARPFDLQEGPMLRVLVLDCGDGSSILVMTLHHIITDERSMQVIIEELVELYGAARTKREARLVPLELQYVDYAAWQLRCLRKGLRERSLAYWTRQLEGDDIPLEIPTDFPRPAVLTDEGARCVAWLDEEQTKRLETLAAGLRTTNFVILMAAFQTLLHRYSNQEDIRVGVPSENRADERLSRVVGFFVNTLVYRSKLSGSSTFEDLVSRVSVVSVDAQSHQELPLEQVVSALNPERRLSYNPLFQVMFNYMHDATPRAQVEALDIELVEFDIHSAQFELSLDTWKENGRIAMELVYRTDLFRRSSAERILQDFSSVLQQVAEGKSSKSLSELDVRGAPGKLSVGLDASNAQAVREPDPSTQEPAFLHVESVKTWERTCAGLWCELLEVSRVELGDNFFQLGGHSLLATRVTSVLRSRHGVEVPLRYIFEAKDLGAFVNRVARLAQAADAPRLALRRVSREGVLPLSKAQERLWFLWQLGTAGDGYHLSVGIRVEGRFHTDAFERALLALVERHETLRTKFVETENGPVSVIETEARISVSCSPCTPAQLGEAVAGEVGASFDLGVAPLARARIFRLSDDEHAVVITVHHIIADDQSLQLMLEEVIACYDEETSGQRQERAALDYQYADFVHYQENQALLQSQLSYWKEQLTEEQPVIELPTDFARPAVQSYRGATQTFRLDEKTLGEIDELARRQRTTRFVVLLSAYATLLYRMSGQHDLRIGVPVSNRTRSEFERVIGIFLNTLVFRVELSGTESLAELLERVQRVLVEARENQDVPFEQVVEELNPQRNLSHSPLFQVTFNHLDDRRELTVPEGVAMTPLDVAGDATQFDLMMTTWEEEGLMVELRYCKDLFRATTIERFGHYYREVLRSFTQQPDAPMNRIVMLNHEEQKVALRSHGTHRYDEWAKKTFPDLFEKQVEENPDAVALRFGERCLTYRRLHQQARALAIRLRGWGVRPDDHVGVCVKRSPELLIAVLGTLLSGAAYVPLDPDYPRTRLEFMLEDSAPRILLCSTEVQAEWSGWAAERGLRVFVVEENGRGELEEGASLPAISSAQDLAYSIYTSGSTGIPKGVSLSHENLANFLAAMRETPGLSSSDRVLGLTSLSFDIAVLELLLPLCVGAQIVLASREQALDPEALMACIDRTGVNLVQATPSTWRMVLRDASPAALAVLGRCRILSGGEALSEDLARELSTQALEVWNMYGPTETTVWSSVARLTPDGGAPTLGAPVQNTRLYLLDEHLNPVPPNVLGELFIGGAGLARGYLGRAATTAERFVPDPFGGAGQRMYRTGDVARIRDDGALLYVRRGDQQVKVRGHRIELGEIEACLVTHPEISNAAVSVWTSEGEEACLVAYVEGVSEGSGVSFRQWLGRKLPSYMIPSYFVELEEFPRTENGKLDRKLLPEPGVQKDVREYVAPRTTLEKNLEELWGEVLRLDRVGVHDGFFELGGHSLLATQLASRVRRRFEINVPLTTFFEATTIAQQATLLNEFLASAIGDEDLDEMSQMLGALENAE